MKGFVSTRFGFFALAAVVSALIAPLAERHLRWVPLALSALYLTLSVLFALDDAAKRRH